MPRPRPMLLFALLLSLACLGACAGRTVDVVQPAQFKIMADRMPDELEARNIIDKNRDYVAGLLPAADIHYGNVLFSRLSPDALFDDIASGSGGRSFAASVRPGDQVARHDKGFSIHRARQNIVVNMIAVTDWEGDGRKDWLVSCQVENLRGGKNRDYYVIIPEPDPAGQGPLNAHVAAVYESFGIAGRLYVRESARKADAPASDSAAPVVEEAVPGLRPVTIPPEKNKNSGSGLQERSL